jgi:type IV pilus assembly protein PilY1
VEKWVAIFGGGYDPSADPNRFSYASDPADALWTAASKAIFIVDLETGDVLQKLAYDSTDADNLARMNFAIPSRPAVFDLDGDGFADAIYIGDLGGQMWKWDISAVAEDADADGVFDEWYSGVFFHAVEATLSSGAKHYRSFFAPPAATFYRGQLHLAFGSGEREELRYEGSDSEDDENRFYVVVDDSIRGSDPLAEDRFTDASTSAVMTEEDIADSDITDLSADPHPYPYDHGFFYKAEEGEKFITDVAIFAGHVIAATYTPTSGEDLCTTAGGQAFLHAFDVGTGTGAFGDPAAPDPTNDRRFAVGGGLPSNPRVSIAPDPEDDTIYIKTSTGQIITIDPPPRPEEPAAVIYWRQKY